MASQISASVLRRSARNIAKNLVEVVVQAPCDQEATPKASQRRTKATAERVELSDESSQGSQFEPENPMANSFVIPEVETRSTTFHGRLGYACMNTILRNKRPARESIFCARTCRIESIKKNGIEWVKDLGKKNIQDLIPMIQWNEENNIRFLRVSSDMFPFASHPEYGYSLDYCSSILEQAGSLAKKYGHRLTMHPGQFTQLGSPNSKVIDAAIRELKYQCEMLERMGVGPDGVLVIHGGGVYGDKVATLERLKTNIQTIVPQNIRDRLVLENDEMSYSAEDLLPLCEELSVPLVFDYHHDNLKPSSIPRSEIIQRANAIFARRGIRPKQHLSEPRPGAVTLMERRAHADRCYSLPPELPDDMDLMIEAKDKEQAVLHLYRIYNLHPVKHESLRPEATNQSKTTKGRKSNKRSKSGAAEKGRSKKRRRMDSEDDEGSVMSDLTQDSE